MSPSIPSVSTQLEQLPANERRVLDAMVLFWGYSGRSQILDLLRVLFSGSDVGQTVNKEEVRSASEALMGRGLLEEHSRNKGRWRVVEPVRSMAYLALLERMPPEFLRESLFTAANYRFLRGNPYWPVGDIEASSGILRIGMLSDMRKEDLERMHALLGRAFIAEKVMAMAFRDLADDAILKRLPASWRWSMVLRKLDALRDHWAAANLPWLEWAIRDFRPNWEAPLAVRYQIAEIRLYSGDGAGVFKILEGIETDKAAALRAATLALAGRWQECQAGFETALKSLRKAYSAKKGLLPAGLLQYYLLALLAQQTPKCIEAARKLALAESGSRQPSPMYDWGLWVHAVDVRLGNAPLETDAFRLHSSPESHLYKDDVWRCLLRAWLGASVVKPVSTKVGREGEVRAVAALRERLQSCGFTWLNAQVETAESVYQGGEAPPNFFSPGSQEAWRSVLASLQSLGGETTAGAKTETVRILWSVTLGKNGSVEKIEPLEQKQGQRGWSKAKPLSLSKLYDNQKLEPWDARVAQAVRVDPYYTKRFNVDRAVAIMALVGHPAVVLANAEDQRVDVVEAAPEMEVARQGDGYLMRITPPMREPIQADRHGLEAEEKREIEALNLITVLRDSPQRIRVIRFTPAQRRAAVLVADRLKVPAAAEAELQKTLHILTSHFQIQSDHAAAAREVETQSRLRAEMAPAGDGLMLRLVVAPLGDEGPRLMPGEGRERVMAALRGEGVGTRRDLKAERRHLEGVLDALPFLTPPSKGDLVAEWVVEDPEQALSMVEALPQLPGVMAVDWPKGKPVRVITVDRKQLGLSVRTERDWLSVSGEVRLDEGLVLELEQLLEWSGSGRGRFLPMGSGVYAALTDRLRAQLADLAAVAEGGKGETRIPQLAAAWLEEAVQGTEVKLDKAFRDRVERLKAAQDQTPILPANLQAELRPYQEDGYAWATRLSAAGFGACLADDMGLGKTLQALAVMLNRAEGGAALVVAPTSVCGNWLAEAGRFAPSLNVQLYGEGDRAAMLEAAGPGDVVLVSCTLMQQSAEGFAGRTWHTLVVDEAQAIKNAAAKRSQAMFDLSADFRMALSGTPVENRLAELWSIMRFCNPGLLGTLTRFNTRFAGPIERDRDREAQHLLRRLIAPFVLRRTKGQVLQELPPRTELTLMVAPDSAEAAHYEALRRQAVAEAEIAAASDSPGQAHFNILAQLTRLRRAACDPRLVSPDLGIVGAKVQAFAQLALELSANGHKTLVFSQFVDFLTLLRAPLDEAGIAYQYLDGATPAAERTRRVNAFQAGVGELFLISLKAGGFGLNLTAADYVVIADPWWNPAAEDQAMGRAHRIGQVRPVTVYRLVNKGSLEERIVSLHTEKRALAEGILAEGESTALPSAEDLIALIRG
jgi:superfamily II DNA or RNA helicase